MITGDDTLSSQISRDWCFFSDLTSHSAAPSDPGPLAASSTLRITGAVNHRNCSLLAMLSSSPQRSTIFGSRTSSAFYASAFPVSPSPTYAPLRMVSPALASAVKDAEPDFLLGNGYFRAWDQLDPDPGSETTPRLAPALSPPNVETPTLPYSGSPATQTPDQHPSKFSDSPHVPEHVVQRRRGHRDPSGPKGAAARTPEWMRRKTWQGPPLVRSRSTAVVISESEARQPADGAAQSIPSPAARGTEAEAMAHLLLLERTSLSESKFLSWDNMA